MTYQGIMKLYMKEGISHTAISPKDLRQIGQV